ncbi:uncharacterized protein LOC141933269 [Strix aluco]|uniref:uncharacterized protein LOC141932956 n=1 Tax=Strix aluco TaxID=111821 RepID=UPI003DA63E5C
MWPWLAAGMCHSPCRCRGRWRVAAAAVGAPLCWFPGWQLPGALCCGLCAPLCSRTQPWQRGGGQEVPSKGEKGAKSNPRWWVSPCKPLPGHRRCSEPRQPLACVSLRRRCSVSCRAPRPAAGGGLSREEPRGRAARAAQRVRRGGGWAVGRPAAERWGLPGAAAGGTRSLRGSFAAPEPCSERPGEAEQRGAARSSAEAERGPGRSRRSRGPEATKPRRSFGDESPVNSTRTSWLAKGRSGRARGTSSPASQKSRVAEDFFNRFPAEGVEAAEGSSASGGEPQGLLQSLKGLDDLEADLLGASRPGSGPGKTTVKGATGYRTDVSFLGMEPQLFPWTSSSLFCTRPDENRCSGSGFGWLRASLVHPKAQLHLWVGSSCTVTTLQALVSLVAAAGMPMGLVVPSNLLSP